MSNMLFVWMETINVHQLLIWISTQLHGLGAVSPLPYLAETSCIIYETPLLIIVDNTYIKLCMMQYLHITNFP